MVTEVTISVDNLLIWARRHEDGNPSGYTKRDNIMLQQVVGLLSEALEQARGELSLFDVVNYIPDVCLSTA